MRLAFGLLLLIAGLGMLLVALPGRDGVPRAFLSGSLEMFYPAISIALMTFGAAMIVSGVLGGP